MDINALLSKIQGAKQNIDARKASGINAVRPPAGETRWRILPGWRKSDRETFYHYYGKHWVKDANGKVLATYLCERDTFGRACSICDALGEAIRSTKDDKILEQLKEMTSRRGVIVNALQISGPQADPTKPVLLDVPPSLFDNTLIGLIESRIAEDIVLLDLKEGRDIIIKKEGTGLSTRYSLTDAAKSTSVDPSVMDKLVDIDAWLAAEKNRGDVKGVSPLNEQIRARLGGPASGRMIGSSLVGASAAAAALAPPMRNLDVEDEVVQTVAAPVAATVKRAPAKPKAEAAVQDEELDKLLADLA